jgi:N-acetylglucosamine-6-phosphate deacetylase
MTVRILKSCRLLLLYNKWAMKKAIINSRLFNGDKFIDGPIIVTRDGFITAIQDNIPADALIIDVKGNNIAPGFIDIQINGGEKYYFTQSPTEATLHDICDASLRHGTTHTLPCLISSPKEKILEAIEVVKCFMQQHNKGVLGMHLEGPFLNPEKRGAHSKDIIRKPVSAELEEIIRYGKDVIKVMTIAPEEFSDEQICMLQDAGIILSAGHSTMNYQQAQYYFNKGISLVTHLYNAMTQMGHREPGMVGAIFDNDAVYAPIILDGAHCDYAAARIAYKLKKDRLFVISDAAFLGRKVKEIDSEFINATMTNGFYRNREGSLAGAAISMVEAVENAIKYVGLSLEEAIAMATINVAKAIKMQNVVGKIEPGYPATFIEFGKNFKSPRTLIA